MHVPPIFFQYYRYFLLRNTIYFFKESLVVSCVWELNEGRRHSLFMSNKMVHFAALTMDLYSAKKIYACFLLVGQALEMVITNLMVVSGLDSQNQYFVILK